MVGRKRMQYRSFTVNCHLILGITMLFLFLPCLMKQELPAADKSTSSEYGADIFVSSSLLKIPFTKQGTGFQDSKTRIETPDSNREAFIRKIYAQFEIGSDLFYENYLLHLHYNRNYSVKGNYEVHFSDSDENDRIAATPTLDELSVRAGFRWFRRGGRSRIQLLAGWLNIFHNGFDSTLKGRSSYYTLSLLLNPSMQVSPGFDMGLHIEVTGGGLAGNKNITILDESPQELFSVSESSGIYASIVFGLTFDLFKSGISLGLRNRFRYFSSKVDGVDGEKAYFENEDFSLLELSVTYHYRSKSYNEL